MFLRFMIFALETLEQEVRTEEQLNTPGGRGGGGNFQLHWYAICHFLEYLCQEENKLWGIDSCKTEHGHKYRD